MAFAKIVILVVFAIASPAGAEDVTSREHLFALDAPSKASIPARVPSAHLQYLYHHERDDLSVGMVRVTYPNIGARRRKTDFFKRLGRSLAAGMPGARVSKGRMRRISGVPVFDQSGRADDHRIRWRVIVFRTFSLVLTTRAASRNADNNAKRIITSFVPKI